MNIKELKLLQEAFKNECFLHNTKISIEIEKLIIEKMKGGLKKNGLYK